MRLGRGGSRKLAATLLGGAFAVLGLGFAVAQEGGSEASGELSARRRAEVSPNEQLAQGRQVVVRGEAQSLRIGGMLDQARRQTDIVRVDCLDDKLTQTNQNVRSARDHVGQLETAQQLNDTQRSNHEYTMLTVLGQNLSELDRQASGCIGQDLYNTASTQIVTTIDPSVPDEDPTAVPIPPDTTVPTIPPPSSPTM
jgi:hypothetical protein